jgi:hypothetical protein
MIRRITIYVTSLVFAILWTHWVILATFTFPILNSIACDHCGAAAAAARRCSTRWWRSRLWWRYNTDWTSAHHIEDIELIGSTIAVVEYGEAVDFFGEAGPRCILDGVGQEQNVREFALSWQNGIQGASPDWSGFSEPRFCQESRRDISDRQHLNSPNKFSIGTEPFLKSINFTTIILILESVLSGQKIPFTLILRCVKNEYLSDNFFFKLKVSTKSQTFALNKNPLSKNHFIMLLTCGVINFCFPNNSHHTVVLERRRVNVGRLGDVPVGLRWDNLTTE